MKKAGGIFAVLMVWCVAAFAAAPAPKTVITGDEMEIMENGDAVVFTGNSKVVRGDSVLNADRIMQDKKADRVEADGRVRFSTYSQEKELVEGRAEKATYRPTDGNGELSGGRPELVYHVKTSTGPVTLKADRIQFDQKKEEVYATGTVEILSSSACANSPQAVFYQKERKVILSGAAPQVKPQPQLIYREGGDTSTYNADRITMYVNQKKILLEGNVHGIVNVKDADNKKAAKGKQQR